MVVLLFALTTHSARPCSTAIPETSQAACFCGFSGHEPHDVVVGMVEFNGQVANLLVLESLGPTREGEASIEVGDSIDITAFYEPSIDGARVLGWNEAGTYTTRDGVDHSPRWRFMAIGSDSMEMRGPFYTYDKCTFTVRTRDFIEFVASVGESPSGCYEVAYTDLGVTRPAPVAGNCEGEGCNSSGVRLGVWTTFAFWAFRRLIAIRRPKTRPG